MALAIDASTPAQATGTTVTITTASFTAPSSTILVALWTANNPSASIDTSINTSGVTNTGTALTWTRRARKNVNASSDGGAGTAAGAEIWTAFNTSSQAMTVSATNSTVDNNAGGGHERTLQIVVLTGGDQTSLTHITTASSTSGLPSVTLTSCTSGSYVFAVSSDWGQKGLGTAGTGQTIPSGWETNVAGQISTHCWRTTSTLSSSGSQTMNLTAPSAQQYNLCVIEVLVSGGAAAGPPPAVLRDRQLTFPNTPITSRATYT